MARWIVMMITMAESIVKIKEYKSAHEKSRTKKYKRW